MFQGQQLHLKRRPTDCNQGSLNGSVLFTVMAAIRVDLFKERVNGMWL